MNPVLLIHGLGSTHEHTWTRHGWPDALVSEGRAVLGLELPGHGGAPAQPVSGEGSEAVSSLWSAVEEAAGTVDIVGFSAGAAVALAATLERPGQVGRLALLGLGDHVLDGIGGADLAEEISRGGDGDAGLVRRSAVIAGNDVDEVAGFAQRGIPRVLESELGRVRSPVLIVNGSRDPAGSAPRLVAGLGARFAALRGVDHFGAPGSTQAMLEVIIFLAEDYRSSSI